jgi:sigma-B regulation protein RsbU (phosphoserine phosphatase)
MHLILEETNDPEEILQKLNRMIRKTQKMSMFVTAIFAVIDKENNLCRLFNAGHLPPYKINAATGEIEKIKKHGIALGAYKDIRIDEGDAEFEINVNDKLVFFTDGVNEAMDPQKQEYGFERMEDYLRRNSKKTPDEIMNGLTGDIKVFTENTDQRDDMTLLIAERKI